MADVSKMFVDILTPLCRQYGLRLVVLGDDRVLLVAQNYALDFYTEPRDTGIFMDYIDIPGSSAQRMQSYALGLFLFSTRPIPAPHTRESAAQLSQEEGTRVDIQQCSRILMERGQDILSGEKEWIKDYPSTWGSNPVTPTVADAIRLCLEDG